MSKFRHRIRHLEKHQPTLPNPTGEDLEHLGFITWRTDPDNTTFIPPDEADALAQYLDLPLEQRQHWRDLGRRYLHYATTHPELVNDVLDEIASTWPAYTHP